MQGLKVKASGLWDLGMQEKEEVLPRDQKPLSQGRRHALLRVL